MTAGRRGDDRPPDPGIEARSGAAACRQLRCPGLRQRLGAVGGAPWPADAVVHRDLGDPDLGQAGAQPAGARGAGRPAHAHAVLLSAPDARPGAAAAERLQPAALVPDRARSISGAGCAPCPTAFDRFEDPGLERYHAMLAELCDRRSGPGGADAGQAAVQRHAGARHRDRLARFRALRPERLQLRDHPRLRRQSADRRARLGGQQACRHRRRAAAPSFQEVREHLYDRAGGASAGRRALAAGRAAPPTGRGEPASAAPTGSGRGHP